MLDKIFETVDFLVPAGPLGLLDSGFGDAVSGAVRCAIMGYSTVAVS